MNEHDGDSDSYHQGLIIDQLKNGLEAVMSVEGGDRQIGK